MKDNCFFGKKRPGQSQRVNNNELFNDTPPYIISGKKGKLYRYSCRRWDSNSYPITAILLGHIKPSCRKNKI